MGATWPKLYTYAGADGHALTIGVHDNGALTWRVDDGPDAETDADTMQRLIDEARSAPNRSANARGGETDNREVAMGETVKSDVEGRCPFCGKPVSVRWGDPPDDPGHLFHGLPTCETFEKMSGDDFVRAVVTKNVRRGN